LIVTAVGWSFLADVVPLYEFYALLFTDNGLSGAQISALFAVWSIVGLLAEVPSGALADRFSPRLALMAAGMLQAAGYAVWLLMPGFVGYAAGFVLWGVGGSLVSGSFEALLYDGLAAAGSADRFARVLGWSRGAGLLAQIPAALAATILFASGGYWLVGWVSVALCVLTAGLAWLIPPVRPPVPAQKPTEPERTEPTQPTEPTEPTESPGEPGEPPGEPVGYLAVLRAGVLESAAHPTVRAAVLAVAMLTGLDALDEYFSLLASGWGVPTVLIPLATLGLPLAGAIGAALGGWANRKSTASLTMIFGCGVAALVAAAVADRPAGLIGLGIYYGLHRMVLVVADTRLQESITGPARATVTSMASLGSEFTALALYAAWAIAGLPVAIVLIAAVAATLPRSLRGRVRRPAGAAW